MITLFKNVVCGFILVSSLVYSANESKVAFKDPVQAKDCALAQYNKIYRQSNMGPYEESFGDRVSLKVLKNCEKKFSFTKEKYPVFLKTISEVSQVKGSLGSLAAMIRKIRIPGKWESVLLFKSFQIALRKESFYKLHHEELIRYMPKYSEQLSAVKLGEEYLRKTLSLPGKKIVCELFQSHQFESKTYERECLEKEEGVAPNFEFSVKNIFGEDFDLPSFVENATSENKVVLIDVWATYCGPCIKGFSKINNLAEKYSDLRIWGVALGESPQKIREIAQSNGAIWAGHYFESDEVRNKFKKQWENITYLSVYILVTKEGVEVFHPGSVSDIEDEIKKHLNTN